MPKNHAEEAIMKNLLNQLKSPLSINRERGSSMVESLIAIFIITGALAVGGVQFKMASKPLADVKTFGIATQLESDIIKAFVDSDSFNYSIKWEKNRSFKRCYLNKTKDRNCKESPKIRYPFSLYVYSTSHRLSGTVNYPLNFSADGIPCRKSPRSRADADKSCRHFTIYTWIRPMCSTSKSAASKNRSCARPSHSVLEYKVYVKGKKKPLAKGFVDQPVKFKQNYDPGSVDLSCPSGKIVVGIGLNRKAICTPLAEVQYIDVPSGVLPPTERISLKAGECVPPHVANPNVKATHFSYVESINKANGSISCGVAELPK